MRQRVVGKSTATTRQAKQDAMLTIGKRDASGNAAKEADHQPRVAVGEEGGVLGCAFSGIWTTSTVALIDAEMRKIEQRKGFQTLALDLSHIEKIDTAGAWLIDRLVSVFEKANSPALPLTYN